MPKEAPLPDYTPGGIQFPIESDKIKDGTSPSALAANFKTLALTADAHTNTKAEEARVAATTDSKAYTDGKDTSNRSAWAQADAERLVEAKAYADDRDEAYRVVDRALWREEDQAIKTAAISEAVATSKTYADERDAAYRTADRALWRSEDQTIKTEAATDATTRANAAKTDAIADATTKYGALPERVVSLENRRALPYVSLFSGTNLDTLRTVQTYRVDSAGQAAGLINAPSSRPATLKVDATTGGLISQVWTDLYGADNAVYKRTTISLGTAPTPHPFGPWGVVHKTGQGRPTLLIDSTDLDTLRDDDDWLSSTISKSRTLINAPTDRPFTLKVQNNGSGSVSQVAVELYNTAGPKMFHRATGNLDTQPYPFGAWVELGAPASAASLPLGWESGAANAILVQDFTRRYGGRKKTGGKGAVAFRFDHGLNNYVSMLLPLMQAREFKHSQVLSSAGWDIAENNAVTRVDVNTLAASGILEVWNHGGMNHSDADTSAKLVTAIVDGLAALRADLPAAKIDGWAVPGVTGTLYMGFNGGITPDKFYATEAGRLILANHAVSTGGIAGTYQRILDGTVRQGQHQYTLDERTVAQAKAEVDLAIANGTGLQFMLHPSVVGTAGRMSLADFTAVLDYVKTKEAAGDLLVLSPYELMVADRF